MIAIFNASPLIYLGKVGALKLLPKLFSKCITTDLVKDEVLKQKNEPEFTVLEESFSTWLNITNPTNQNLTRKLEQLQLHPGEASVIALAKEFQENGELNIVIVDDLTAREIARTLDLTVTGTLGIILKSLHLKLITKTESKNFLRILIEETSFRISTALYSKVLKEIDDL